MDGNVAGAAKGFIESRGVKFPKRQPFIAGQVRGSLRAGTYENKEVEAALKVTQPGDTVLELGAGIGFLSAVLSQKRDVAHVHAFEANPHLIPYIKEVHTTNDIQNVTVHNAVLGARKGKAKFYVRKKFIASSLAPIKGSIVTAEVPVEIRNAKSVMKELQPDVLICDIEGAEIDVIPLLDLSKLRAAVIELHPQWIGPEGMNAVFSAFIGAGLAYWAGGSNGKVVTFRRNWPIK